jgi:hypothetical protein
MTLLGACGTFAGAVPPLLVRGDERSIPPDPPMPTSSAMGDWRTRRTVAVANG